MPAAQKLYTLTDISKRTGISMPTLLRYKREHQARLPTVGKGRSQRYRKEALAVFRAIKKENMRRRGRPPKKGAKTAKAAGKRQPTRTRRRKGEEGNLTLLEIGRRTGISYPTLIRYVKLHGKEIPHVGKGRSRRFKPEAVAKFKQLRRASKRGPKPSGTGAARARASEATIARRLHELEKAQREVSRQLDAVVRLLRQPLKITVETE